MIVLLAVIITSLVAGGLVGAVGFIIWSERRVETEAPDEGA